jgi:NH3-dependent NAD+ synthetase/predicted amidohydrolase
MVLTGYPPMDLLERDGFVQDQLHQLDALRAAARHVAIALGAVVPVEGTGPARLANAAVVLAGGERAAVRAKTLLPTYDVFDEKRYFAPAQRREPVAFGDAGATLGLGVCEDVWGDSMGYRIDPVAEFASAGVSVLLNPSCSPWHVGKALERRRMIAELAARHGLPIVFVNQVGGNDELIFDGGSFAADADGRIHAALPLFDSAFGIVEIPVDAEGHEPEEIADPDHTAQLEAGLVLGIRDYFRKQNLPLGAVVALSGGIDSAVTAHLGAEALGPDRVLGIAMPGPFSSEHSVADAEALGRNLGIEVRRVDIGPIYAAYIDAFRALFGEREDYGITQQNIQSRIRGAIAMAVSNADGRLVLATGKYALARRANASGERVPRNTIEKPPSAELAPGQLDCDDLPDYDTLDAILEQAIEGNLGVDGIRPPPGASQDTVRGVVARLDRNEYKRRQAPLVLRTTPKAFGSGRRLPIVHRYAPTRD